MRTTDMQTGYRCDVSMLKTLCCESSLSHNSSCQREPIILYPANVVDSRVTLTSHLARLIAT